MKPQRQDEVSSTNIGVVFVVLTKKQTHWTKNGTLTFPRFRFPHAPPLSFQTNHLFHHHSPPLTLTILPHPTHPLHHPPVVQYSKSMLRRSSRWRKDGDRACRCFQWFDWEDEGVVHKFLWSSFQIIETFYSCSSNFSSHSWWSFSSFQSLIHCHASRWSSGTITFVHFHVFNDSIIYIFAVKSSFNDFLFR